MCLVCDDNNIGTVGELRVPLPFFRMKLVNQRKDVAVILLQQFFQMLSTLGLNLLFSNCTYVLEGLINLVI